MSIYAIKISKHTVKLYIVYIFIPFYVIEMPEKSIP